MRSSIEDSYLSQTTGLCSLNLQSYNTRTGTGHETNQLTGACLLREPTSDKGQSVVQRVYGTRGRNCVTPKEGTIH